MECSTRPRYTSREETRDTAAQPRTRPASPATIRCSGNRTPSNASQVGGSLSNVASPVAMPAA
ncbi:hypothetical protein J2T22_001306 [Pseudarthrobacter defluvii]|uniref:Uncharacterized protein n=1 Tax=Pseudarthrobacter defluvii TaxID=410837 RepID=A0ABT9UES7_9MICC|nr:hypothetical protein [Pseudarthrobacter defluvii]